MSIRGVTESAGAGRGGAAAGRAAGPASRCNVTLFAKVEQMIQRIPSPWHCILHGDSVGQTCQVGTQACLFSHAYHDTMILQFESLRGKNDQHGSLTNE